MARGGTGTIYRARDEAGGAIALKVVHADLTKSPVDRSRIKREVTKATSVTHGAIARVREVGETEGRIFLVRDFVEGDALASILRRDGPLDVPRAARIVHAVAAALVEAHRAGVLHRDLNARHVIVQLDGAPAILDFALSAPIPGGIAGKPVNGSLESLAPEQAAGKLVTLRADLYGLGLLFRQMLTGEAPVVPEDPAEALALRAEAEAPPAPAGVPPPIATLLSQLLARDPKDRPFGARAVEKVLSEMARSAAPRATTAPLKPAVRIAEVPAPGPVVRIPPPRGATLPMAAAVPEVAAFEIVGSEPAAAEPTAAEPTAAEPTGPQAAGTQPYPTLPSGPPEPETAGPPLERQLDDALEVVAREKTRRDDSTAVLGSGTPRAVPTPRPRPPSSKRPRPPSAKPVPGGGRPGPLPRGAKKTLIGIPLPSAPDPSTAVRQKWARSVLGLGEGEGTPVRSAESLGIPDSLEPPRRAATAQGTGQPASTSAPPPMPVPDTLTPPALPITPAAPAAPPPPAEPARAPEGGLPSLLEMVQETEAEQWRLEQLEAAASALSSPPPEPHPPVPAMPTAASGAPVLAPRASAAETWSAADADDALAFRRPANKRLWIFGGIGALVVFGAVGVIVALSGGGGTTPHAGGPRTPAPPVRPTPPTPPPIAAPPPLPPTPTPPVVTDGGAVATADAGVAASPDGGEPTTADGGAAVAATADGGAAQGEPTPAPPVVVPPGTPDDDPRSTADLIKVARANVRKRRWAEARRTFDIVLRREPANLDALLGAALVAVSERRTEDAVRYFRGAVAQRPDSATYHVYLGNAYLMNDDRESAEREWRRALEIDPNQREARTRLGIRRGGAVRRPEKAPTKPPQAIRRNPYGR